MHYMIPIAGNRLCPEQESMDNVLAIPGSGALWQAAHIGWPFLYSGGVMLRNIDPILSPELIDVLFRMGHGDEIVLADAFFTGDSLGKRVLRSDGISVSRLLEGIMPLITLDRYVPTPLFMMQPAEGDRLDKDMEKEYRAVIDKYWPETPPFARVERFAFYQQTRQAFAVVMTGETRKYGNLILKKGVIDR